MTSILAFKIDNGNQIIIVGDTQHTYPKSTLQKSKLSIINKKIVYCGAGLDDVIENVHYVIDKKDLTITNCEEKLESAKSKLISDWREITNKVPDKPFEINTVTEAQFMFIDGKNLKGTIFSRTFKKIEKFNIIGSGEDYIGKINLDDFYKIKFTSYNRKKLFDAILYHYSELGKSDPTTGHPAIFDLEIFVLTKNNPIQTFLLQFKYKDYSIKNFTIKKND